MVTEREAKLWMVTALAVVVWACTMVGCAGPALPGIESWSPRMMAPGTSARVESTVTPAPLANRLQHGSLGPFVAAWVDRSVSSLAGWLAAADTSDQDKIAAVDRPFHLRAVGTQPVVAVVPQLAGPGAIWSRWLNEQQAPAAAETVIGRMNTADLRADAVNRAAADATFLVAALVSILGLLFVAEAVFTRRLRSRVDAPAGTQAAGSAEPTIFRLPEAQATPSAVRTQRRRAA